MTEEEKTIAYRKAMLQMPILGITRIMSSKRAYKRWLSENYFYNPARQNYEAYRHGMKMRWRVYRYYRGYHLHKPPHMVKREKNFLYDAINVKQDARYLNYKLHRGPIANFFRYMPRKRACDL